MKRIASTLILSVVIFVSTITISITFISRKSIQTSDYLNSLALESFLTKLDADIRLTELSTRNFLSGIPSMSIDNDSTSIIVDEKAVPEFGKLISGVLPHFMKINKYYRCSMFVIDNDICRQFLHCPKGYVPYITQGDSTIYDLSDGFDFVSSPQYQKIKREKKSIWTTFFPTSREELGLLTLNVPMILSDGRFFGVFSVSLDIKTVNDELRRYLPYGEDQSAIFIVDENDEIFSSCPEWIMNNHSNNVVGDYKDFTEGEGNGKEYFVIEYDEKEYYVYQRDFHLLSWKIFAINEKDAIYRETFNVVKALVLSSVIGMLLMLVCCVVVFRQIRKNLRVKAAVEEELRMSAMVQSSMLKPSGFTLATHSSPIILDAFMRPAKEVGGDLYDYIEKDGQLIFCIGDVSGKGMPAALFMTQVVSLFRNAVRFSSEPSEIVRQINNVLSDNVNVTFCTFFVGVVCEDELSFCNAGHNPPVLVSSGASYLNVLSNLAVGLDRNYQYRSERIPFKSGDKLVLYTDGITEAKNKEHKLFGNRRLLEVFATLGDNDILSSPGSINARIIESVERFVQQAEQSDDITVVTLVRNC